MEVSSYFNLNGKERGNDERMDNRWEINIGERKKEMTAPHQI
jgi:hypothetical protein